MWGLHLSGRTGLPFQSPGCLPFRLRNGFWSIWTGCSLAVRPVPCLYQGRKPFEAGGRDGQGKKQRQRPQCLWMTCRCAQGLEGQVASSPVPFPCEPLRDMQLFEAVAVRRMETYPEAP